MQLDSTMVIGPQDEDCYKQLRKAGLKVHLSTLGDLFDSNLRLKKPITVTLTNSNTDESRPIQHAFSN